MIEQSEMEAQQRFQIPWGISKTQDELFPLAPWPSKQSVSARLFKEHSTISLRSLFSAKYLGQDFLKIRMDPHDRSRGMEAAD